MFEERGGRGQIEFDLSAKIPTFKAFLETNWGEVEFGEEATEAKRHGMKEWMQDEWPIEPHVGVSVEVKLNGATIGNLEVYDKPATLYFAGEIPGINAYKRKWSRKKGDGIILVYTTEGRQDGWEKVPFP